ncbi:hypothetical protein LTR10_017395 [Elasticomyces elasticus]|uniref:F-box domain-containing protein n=1 Tax=Exophiala sideris TaxID=1016849 RepID=A0ABR0J9S7_9EURO|nr:hypothetical protein LTR10_017395 [Elasticomyces elasticus]KAK5027849.1 hypothetical protein LTS07_006724 [Exophiala sideris]KAK5037562.1 hypothetical protein LTR13_004720 [Exophiala sideris]KAK5059223.1 hypothetical protein LTR69_006513 [Exophiala sideris]KAK5183057.1 hypothetical protein LTR44_004768 [Eurotiomycetes sp. CCFEE 6388]
MSSSSGGLTLPDEILSVICEQLGRDGDFRTLYQCARGSKSLADPALRTMYQQYQTSPVFEQRDDLEVRKAVDYTTRAAEQTQTFRKWTVLWRSIVLSSFDDFTTYKPYCRYIKTLDFRNLSAMLDDYKFTGAIRKSFFAGRLQPFHFPKKELARQTVDVIATVNAIGEAVTVKATLLEEIDGHISPGFLPRWIARSPKLETLVLWKGDALASGAGAAIAQHCEHFKSLTIHEWRSPDADDSFATFLDELKPDTLSYFEMISYNDLGRRSFEALGRHRTLQELELSNLNQEAMQNLSALKACTEIHTLKLDDSAGNVQLENMNHDVFVEVIGWLSSCRNLRDLTLKNFFDGPAILAQVLYSPNVELTKLSLEGYSVRYTSARLFHSALAEQNSLESVWLKGNGEDTTPDDLQIMVQGLCNMTNLRELVLKDVSDEFEEEHIISLALSLPLLEDFWTSGGEVSADILPPLVNMKRLKNLTLYAMTQFTTDALTDFITNLDPATQKGFNLSLMAAHPDFDLSDGEQELIRDLIRTTLDGRFDFVLWREADTSDSEDD